jgi:DNA-directed RNA polymerase sigma subunit (sigma70/sigma32)
MESSLSAPADCSPHSANTAQNQNLGDILASHSIPADEVIIKHQSRESLMRAIDKLEPIEADIIRARFFGIESADSVERRVRAGKGALTGIKEQALSNLKKILLDPEEADDWYDAE